MKLGNYYQKSVPVKQKRGQSIIVTNERIKKEFEKQVKDRDRQITNLTEQVKVAEQRIVAESNLYEDIRGRHYGALETIRNHEEQDAENFKLKTRVGQLQPQAEQVAPLKHQLMETKEKLIALQTERSKFLHEIEMGKNEIIQDKQIIEGLKAEAVGATFTISTYEGDHTATLKETEELKHELELLREQTIQQVEDINLLSTNFFYWKDTAQDFQQQLEKDAELRKEIQQTLDILTQEHRLEGKKVSKTSRAYQEATATILELNNRNLELTEFTEQMSKIIIEQRKSLATAGYMSQGSIGAKEGFHIPFAKEAIRKQQLGNAPPTLLKFKEIDNDN